MANVMVKTLFSFGMLLALANGCGAYGVNDDQHILFLLDRSGSMDAIRNDVIGGFNSYIADLAANETAADTQLFLTLAQFDSQEPFELLTETRSRISAVPPLTPEDFRPRGGTPLYDAIMELMMHGEKHQIARAGLPGVENEDRVVVVVFTDGEENASSRHTRSDVLAKIEKLKEEHGWTFVFLGANIDSYAQGGSIGISRRNTQNFAFDAGGVKSAFRSLSKGQARMLSASFESSTAAAPEYDFFAGDKSAEQDMAARNNGGVVGSAAGGTAGATGSLLHLTNKAPRSKLEL